MKCHIFRKKFGGFGRSILHPYAKNGQGEDSYGKPINSQISVAVSAANLVRFAQLWQF
ncbi:MAG: hypothetical protein LBH14_01795 [Desulfobulbaceae bacterium]|nr:hypothetical protein [Desulfobulbaceae bacterium]